MYMKNFLCYCVFMFCFLLFLSHSCFVGFLLTSVNATSIARQDDFMDIDEPFQVDRPEQPLSLLSAARGRSNADSLPDESFIRRFLDASSDFGQQAPIVTHPRNVREIPIEVKDGDGSSDHSGRGPTVEDVTGTEHYHGPEVDRPVIVDEGDDVPAESTARVTRENEDTEDSTGVSSRNRNVGPSPSGFDNYNEDIEEEMIQAAIEASKRDIERSDLFQNVCCPNHSSFPLLQICHISFPVSHDEKIVNRLPSKKGHCMSEGMTLETQKQWITIVQR